MIFQMRLLIRELFLDSGCNLVNKIKLRENKLFVLGRNFNLTSFDTQTGVIDWKAKNLPRTELNLVPPIDLTDIIFNKDETLLVLNGLGNVNLLDYSI